MSELVEVGDIIQTTSFMGTNDFPVTRVTKTLAMSRRESDGYEHVFKRLIGNDMHHPHQRYNTVTCNVIKSLESFLK